jgi:hypothetical protein
MSVEGKFYTPREMLAEARKHSQAGRTILRNFMLGKRTNPGENIGAPATLAETELDALAEARVRAVLARYPADQPVVYVLSGGFQAQPEIRGGGLTPAQLLEQLDQKTPEGQKLIDQEKKYMLYLENLKKKV